MKIHSLAFTILSLAITSCRALPYRTVASHAESLPNLCNLLLGQETGPFNLHALVNGEAFETLKLVAAEIERTERSLGLEAKPAEPLRTISPARRAIDLLVQRSGWILAEISRHAPLTPADVDILRSSVEWNLAIAEVSKILDADRRLIFDDANDIFLIDETDYGRVMEESRPTREGPKEIRVVDGLLLHRGRPLDTKSQRWIFAWNRQRRLRASPASGRLFHDDLFPGEELAMAGEWIVRAGRLILVTDQSGHFAPPRFLSAQFFAWLRAQGVTYGFRRKLLAPAGSSAPKGR